MSRAGYRAMISAGNIENPGPPTTSGTSGSVRRIVSSTAANIGR